jgi:LPXTG-site transpeptidase (sortase) family protein
MYFNLTQNQYDRVVPPSEYHSQNTQVEQKQKVRITMRAVVRSLAVLVVSFAIVFSSLYTILTWPLAKIQVGYYLSQLRPAEQTVQAQEQLLPLAFENPNEDSDGDGYTDAIEVEAGYDPYSAEPTKLDSDQDGIKDDVERKYYGTDPLKADTDGDGHADLEEIVNGFSPIRPANYSEWLKDTTSATISIPKINVVAPVVWTKNPDLIEEDLDRGVTHYPGTDNPGGDGNVVITGHSSAWVLDDDNYGTVFALIDKLVPGDKIYIDYMGTKYAYEVKSHEIKDPYDTSNFANTQDPTLTIMTCWPRGSTARRYYVISELVGAKPLQQ